MSVDSNRLLLEMERILRETNKAIINPEFEALQVTDLEPTVAITARARAAYLKKLVELSNTHTEGLPSEEEIQELRLLRLTFDELISAAQAMHTAIERGYLDVGVTTADT